MREEEIINHILEFVKDRKRRELNKCNVGRNALKGVDTANIQRTLEKFGYKTYVTDEGLEIRW